MTVIINVGRRIPRAWFKRQMNVVSGLMSFQENMWLMIKQSFNMAKKKADYANNGVKISITKDYEIEDINFELEWLKVMIQGSKEQEEEEYEDALKFYVPFQKILKKDMPKDENMSRHFKSKLMSMEKIEEAYKKGYGAVGNKNVSNLLLEMGILTHIEFIDDTNAR
jgi:hypothetical protein